MTTGASDGDPRHAGSSVRREHSLDGVRGVAAINVLIIHYLTVFWIPPFADYEYWRHVRSVLEWTPVSLLWAGEQAVLLFFILSGFALYRMLEGQHLTLTAFYIRRVCRLWIPYVVSLGVVLLAVALVPPRVYLPSIWLDPAVPNTVTAHDLGQHLLMVGQFNTFKINGVIWSLVQEMRMSLVFPLLYVIVRRVHWAVIMSVSIALAAWAITYERPINVPTELTSWWRTLQYQMYFVTGAVLAHHSASLEAAYHRIPERARLPLFLVVLVLYGDLLHVASRASVLIGSIALMVVAISSERAKAMLTRPWLQMLGRISFSFYLLHRFVQITIANAFYPSLDLVTISIVSVPLAVLAGYLSHRFVEVPANELGRRLAARQRAAEARVPA